MKIQQNLSKCIKDQQNGQLNQFGGLIGLDANKYSILQNYIQNSHENLFQQLQRKQIQSQIMLLNSFSFYQTQRIWTNQTRITKYPTTYKSNKSQYLKFIKIVFLIILFTIGIYFLTNDFQNNFLTGIQILKPQLNQQSLPTNNVDKKVQNREILQSLQKIKKELVDIQSSFSTEQINAQHKKQMNSIGKQTLKKQSEHRQNKQKGQNLIPDKINSNIHIQPNLQLPNNIQNSNRLIDQKSKAFIKDDVQCKNYILQKLQKHGQLYQIKVQFQQFKYNSNSGQFKQMALTQITKQKFTQSIQLIDLIHRIDQKGNLHVQENPCESVQSITMRLNNSMQSQKKRLNEAYEMNKYFYNQLRFCIVVNSYNNAHNGLIYRNLDSIIQQDYTNYYVVYTDDNSPDNNGELAKKYIQSKNLTNIFKFNLNKQKVGMMKNIYDGIVNDCRMGQIAVMLDGDDSFIGRNVLAFLNAAYQKYKVALMWNNFDTIFTNFRAGTGFSADFQTVQKAQNNFRSTLGFKSSHLKSFYVDLFRKILKEDLQHQDKTFYGGASDLAVMYPMIEMTNIPESPKFKYVPQIMYQYRYDTGQLGMVTNRAYQNKASRKIKSTPAYKPLDISQFVFIQQSIKNVLIVQKI